MADTTLADLLAAVEEAQRARDAIRDESREVRRRETQAENAVIAAEKAVVDYLVARHPSLADEVAKRSERLLMAALRKPGTGRVKPC